MKNNLWVKKISGFTQPLRAGTGFTLIEVIIVIVILSILAAFSLPQLSKMMENQKAKQGVKILYDLYTAQRR
ncbi:MAG: prepilin-type N-terminal cleavage/methylation domain-containing protein, partial [Candidatus Omnitrophica bacterium]|nr:prepilin-type N-terminal cleavage/methylation domain-containing protein [Candidatus Omnitrophota bacterium]